MSDATADEAVQIVRLARGYVNVWVVSDADSAIVVDTHYHRAEGWLERKLPDVVGSKPITAIVVTHAHGDHAGGALALHERLGVPVILGAGDDATTRAGHNPKIRPTSLFAAMIKPSIPQKYPAFTADVLVEDRLDLAPYGLAGEVVRVGGHTDGSVVVRLGSAVVTGDLVRGRMIGHHRVTEHLYQPDTAPVHDTLRRLIADGAIALYPGHGEVLASEDVSRWLDRKDN